MADLSHHEYALLRVGRTPPSVPSAASTSCRRGDFHGEREDVPADLPPGLGTCSTGKGNKEQRESMVRRFRFGFISRRCPNGREGLNGTQAYTHRHTHTGTHTDKYQVQTHAHNTTNIKTHGHSYTHVRTVLQLRCTTVPHCCNALSSALLYSTLPSPNQLYCTLPHSTLIYPVLLYLLCSTLLHAPFISQVGPRLSCQFNRPSSS